LVHNSIEPRVAHLKEWVRDYFPVKRLPNSRPWSTWAKQAATVRAVSVAPIEPEITRAGTVRDETAKFPLFDARKLMH
jgi:hypothetical protein